MRTVMSAAILTLVATGVDAAAQPAPPAPPITCGGKASFVKAATIAEDYFPVTTRFQVDQPPLQPMLATRIVTTGPGRRCVVATFSAVATLTDNYMVFQVALDGVPMLGHTLAPGGPFEPIVVEPEETNLNLPRMVSHQFFMPVGPGSHVVEVRVAAGSNLDPAAPPTVTAPVLTVQYQ